MVPENEGTLLSFIPPDLLGPTGKVFFHGDGNYSTHLNMVVNHPGKQGEYTYIPLLVPEQVGINDLLSGKPPTKEQLGIAYDDAKFRFKLMEGYYPSYKSVDEALTGEKDFHDNLVKRLHPLIKGNLPTKQNK